jgi:hypothetical protein
MNTLHTFHIPVMGSGFTIDTPLKVSQYGISSVISLVDDVLMEKIRRVLCKEHDLPFIGINPKHIDCRAERITAYLNLLEDLSKINFEKTVKDVCSSAEAADKYFGMLPGTSPVAQEYLRLRSRRCGDFGKLTEWICSNMVRGSIDVNIMTKLDRPNYYNDEKLPAEYNDAHSALRGFAHSKLHASVVLSAGLNPELFGYIAGFPDFFPDSSGNLKKKIVIKVSDYRSALIQGKFLAKKGLWVSEFRIESGVNCGGHAFPTNGLLLGPILEEFRNKREELHDVLHLVFSQALISSGQPHPENKLPLKITAQGGIGTAAEHRFFMQQYQLDSIGWGTPFLLVPEVTRCDPGTLNLLLNAGVDDVYISNTSPLMIPFYSVKGNTRDAEKEKRIEEGLPGTSCPRKYLALDKEFSDHGLCPASFEYQHHKLEQLEQTGLSGEEYRNAFLNITGKACICAGLGTPALIAMGLDTNDEGPGESVCPSPNIAWFNKTASLKEMLDHIYGRNTLINEEQRPGIFITELFIYISYLKKETDLYQHNCTKKQLRHLLSFCDNLKDGLQYYRNLFTDPSSEPGISANNSTKSISEAADKVDQICNQIMQISCTG